MENASECKHSCTILQYSGQEVINAPIKKDDTMEYYKFAYKFSNSDNKGPIIYFFDDRSPFYKFLGSFIAIHITKGSYDPNRFGSVQKWEYITVLIILKVYNHLL